jgi:hypothetical protein
MYLTFIDIDTLFDAGKYINNLKPKSKYREYKKQILMFIDTLEKDSNLEKKDIVELNRIYLSSLITFLMSEHGFKQKHGWLWSGVFTLVLDLILIFTGIAQYYYYLPILTVITVIRSIWKIKKAKTENKFLDL